MLLKRHQAEQRLSPGYHQEQGRLSQQGGRLSELGGAGRGLQEGAGRGPQEVGGGGRGLSEQGPPSSPSKYFSVKGGSSL